MEAKYIKLKASIMIIVRMLTELRKINMATISHN